MAKDTSLHERKRILCVDDDADSLEMLCTVLRNYDTVAASNVRDALRVASSERFDLYVLDNRYRDGTGIELCRQLRSFDQLTPVLFLSGLDTEAANREAIDAGAQAYMVKPIRIDELEQRIEQLIQG